LDGAPRAIDASSQAPERELSPLFLTPPIAAQVEQALCRVGAFGEVRLLVVKGRLRFIEIMRSETIQEP
jgi:hypothetical protein